VMVMDWGTVKVGSRQSLVVGQQSLVDSPSRLSESVDSPSRLSESVDSRQSDSSLDSRGATADGTVVGTKGFMAPEQARGEVGLIDERADVYGLGAILFLLLTDVPPVADADPGAKLRALRVPRPLAAICTTALAADPARRYQSVEALADDVARYRGGRAVHAYPEPAMERLVRFGRTYRTAILLILAYIVMRAVVAFVAGW